MPLQFGLLLAVGRDVQPEEMSSMDAIAKAVSRKTESYMGDRTCGELVEAFYPLIVDDILQNRQVNRDTLRAWLEDLRRLRITAVPAFQKRRPCSEYLGSGI